MLKALRFTIIPFITRTCYRKEMVFVLGLKLVMLMGLWVLFYSHPVDHSLTNIELVEHFMTARFSG